MSLYSDAKTVLQKIIGKEVDGILNDMDKPDDYPQDFLEEIVDFTSKLIGINETLKLFAPIAKKYHMSV